MSPGARPGGTAGPAAERFADILSGLRPALPAALLDGAGWERMLAHVADLPAAAARTFGFELRLAEAEPSADLALSVVPGTPAAELYLQAGEAAGRHPVEGRLARCIGEMGHAGSPLARHAGGAFLGYDVATGGPGSLPGIYLALRPEAAEHRGVAVGAVAAALADIAGWPADARERRAVERASGALPPDGTMVWVGAMPGRGKRAIRLVVRGIEGPAATRGFLERLGWPGNIEAAGGVLAGMSDVCDPAQVQFSFGVSRHGPEPALGMELSVGRRPFWTTTQHEEWRPLVERLVGKGWCLPAKAAGLLAWPGRDKLFTERGPLLVHRGINHAKVSIADGETSAKAYVGAGCWPIGWS